MLGFCLEPQALDMLTKKVLIPLVHRKATDASIRIWVVGCGRGEETYTIAMLLTERLEAAQKDCPLHIFATDLDAQELSVARSGIYSEHIAAELSSDRLRRFFVPIKQTYEVNKQMRGSVTFALHNPISDPPFTKLDLICCCKLLIELEPSAWRRLIARFYYALTKEGTLFLGSAEIQDPLHELFEPISQRWGIYRRIELQRHHGIHLHALAEDRETRGHQVSAQPLTLDPVRLRGLMHHLLQDYTPAALLIDRRGQILYYNGPIDHYLKPPDGVPTDDLMTRARKELCPELLAAVTEAIRSEITVVIRGARLQRNGSDGRVRMTVKPVKAPNVPAGMLLIIFEDEFRLQTSRRRVRRVANAEISLGQSRYAELETVQQIQQTTIMEQRSDNERLIRINKKFRAMNEELQLINEELELARKQYQSLNEELTETNSRLQAKITELGEANNDLDNLLNGSDIATIFLDTQCQIKRFTPNITELLNLIPTDVGRPIGHFSGKLQDADLLTDAQRVLEQITPCEKEVGTEARSYLRRIVPYRTRDNRIEGVVISFIDVTEQRRIAKKLAYHATHDTLTGLVNRREFERLLKRILATAKAHGTENTLCYLDLDQFKVVNDTCGHIAGDALLRQIGGILQTHVRERDIVARLGGDEFGILMEHCTLDEGRRVANKLREAIENLRFLWEAKSFGIGASIGMVSIHAGSGSTSDILKYADAACYVAKESGRNRVHVAKEKDSEVTKRQGEMQWIGRINSALAKNRFCLCYQPISPTRVANDQASRYELLLRIQAKDGVMITPAAFLPAAERYALCSRLDRWVIQAAFHWLKSHPKHLQRLELCSINLSGQFIGDESSLEFVSTRIKEDQLPPNKLCFEITETTTITHLGTAIRFIRELRTQGCHFSLDDFGSGLCSFAYLKNLPVDYLKIDGSFVKDIVDDPVDLAMVKSINEVGKILGLQTVAEWVENAAILAKLRELDVNFVQGYAIAPPRPLAEMGDL
jgi:diguanylate cyclase (GGDEF)-like protein